MRGGKAESKDCAEALTNRAQVKDRQPLLTPEDCVLAEDIAKADAEVAAMVKEAYGITDLSLLACDPWSGVPACPPLPGHVQTPAHACCQRDMRGLTGSWRGNSQCASFEVVCAGAQCTCRRWRGAWCSCGCTGAATPTTTTTRTPSTSSFWSTST